jgi:hypothetical protein
LPVLPLQKEQRWTLSILKKIHFKIFAPGNKKYEHLDVQAPKGQRLTAKGIEHCIRVAADKCEELYPNDEHRLVKISEGQYNIVWVRKLPVEESCDTTLSSTS